MATRSQRAVIKLQRWKNEKRYKFREISKATGLSQGTLCMILKEPDKQLTLNVMDAIIAAVEPK